MNILITGGAGYIGGTVTRLLLADGHSVTVFDNLSHSKRLAVADGAEFVEGSRVPGGSKKVTFQSSANSIFRISSATRLTMDLEVPGSMRIIAAWRSGKPADATHPAFLHCAGTGARTQQASGPGRQVGNRYVSSPC